MIEQMGSTINGRVLLITISLAPSNFNFFLNQNGVKWYLLVEMASNSTSNSLQNFIWDKELRLAELTLYDRATVESYLKNHTDVAVIRKASSDAKRTLPTALAVLSYRKAPGENSVSKFSHTVLDKNTLNETDLHTLAPHTNTYMVRIPNAGGRRKTNKRRKIRRLRKTHRN